MRQATRRIVGPHGQPMIRTATESTVNGVRLRSVEDVIDLEMILAEYRRRVPLWRRVLDAIVREVREGGAA